MSLLPCFFVVNEIRGCNGEELLAFFEPARTACEFHQQLGGAVSSQPSVELPVSTLEMNG